MPISGTSSFVNFTKTIVKTKDNYICAKIYFNDTSGNTNQTELTDSGSCFTVANSAPATPSVTYPQDDIAYPKISINVSSSDADGDSITYKIYINGTLNITTTSNVTVWNASDGYYELKVSATDGTDTSSNSSAIQFKLDSTLPAISWNSPSSSYTISSFNTYTFDIDVTDDYLDCAGLFINYTNGTELYRNISCGVASPFTFVDSVDFSSFADGNISVETCANDTATTSPPIPDYLPTVKQESKEIDFKEDGNVDVTVKIEILDNSKAPVSISDRTLTVKANHDGKHIFYGGESDKMNSGDKVKFTYHSNNDLKFVERQTDLPCHITIGNKFYQHKGLIDKGWKIENCSFNKDDYDVIAYMDDYSKGKNKDNVYDFDPMSGQVNSKCEVRHIYRDTTNPIMENLSLSSSTVQIGSTATISADCGDSVEVDTVYVNITDPNDITTRYSMTYSSGNTYQKTYTVGLPGNHNLSFECHDKAGNMASNSSTGLAITGTTVSGGGSGGGGGGGSSTTLVIAQDSCNIKKIKPSSGNIWLMKDSSIELIVKNIFNTSSTFTFSVIGDVDCEVEHKKATINGASTFTNALKCVVNDEKENGKVIVESFDQSNNNICDTSFNIVADKSFVGRLFASIDPTVLVLISLFIIVVVILLGLSLYSMFS